MEDEAPVAELLELLIREVDEEVVVVASCNNVDLALEKIHALKPDLVFLDVILPYGTGFDIAEQIAGNNCEIIFTTAHEGYAIEAFKHAAAGYLLKPVDHEELRIALDHAKRRIRNQQHSGTDFSALLKEIRAGQNGQDKIALQSSDGFLFVKASEIIRCESDRIYTWVFLNSQKKILCSYAIGEVRKLLPDHTFCQIHKSHIISFNFVRSYNGRENTVELSDGTVIPVSRRSKHTFLNHFKMLHKGLED